PVMYFYLPPGAATPQVMDVSAEFHGGWLSQFFPYATATAPGLSKTGVMTPGGISNRTIGTLEWNSVKVGEADAPLPEANEHVWTSPRKVEGAASLTTLNES